jgi:hypothetical protein
MSMTPYAMSAHLALNLVWLWLFLRNTAASHAGAIAVGFLARSAGDDDAKVSGQRADNRKCDGRKQRRAVRPAGYALHGHTAGGLPADGLQGVLFQNHPGQSGFVKEKNLARRRLHPCGVAQHQQDLHQFRAAPRPLVPFGSTFPVAKSLARLNYLFVNVFAGKQPVH